LKTQDWQHFAACMDTHLTANAVPEEWRDLRWFTVLLL